MSTNKLFWIPRVVTILFILFLSLFTLDVFSVEATLVEKLVGFLVHLIPSFILLIVLIISWRYPIIGGFIFIFFSIVFTFHFKTYRFLSYFLTISFPLVIIGALFIIFHIILRKK